MKIIVKIMIPAAETVYSISFGGALIIVQIMLIHLEILIHQFLVLLASFQTPIPFRQEGKE